MARNKGPFLSLFHIIILSIVEGITEFLPVSSTGHLILASNILQIPETEFVKSFIIAIQGGTIFSVIFLYWKRLFVDFETMKRVAAAFVPTAVIGLLLYKIIKKILLGNPMVVLVTMFLGGLIIIVFEWKHRETNHDISDVARIPYSKAVAIGAIQALAVIPGVSRSAATILGGLALGVQRKTIVEFSFLLAVPTLLAATALDLLKSSHSFTTAEWGCLGLGSVISFIVAVLSIRLFLGFVQRFSLTAFGVYRIAAAVLFWYFA